MNSLLQFDLSLFLLINHLPHTGITDGITQFISGVGTAGIIWFIAGLYLILKEERKDSAFLLPLFATGGLSYLVTEIVLKHFFARLRPTVELGAIIVGKQSLDPSFPSGHATIAFAMAALLSAKEPKLRWLWYTGAVLIGLSRVYLGKHYPLDVVGGAFVGLCIGYSTIAIYAKFFGTRKAS